MINAARKNQTAVEDASLQECWAGVRQPTGSAKTYRPALLKKPSIHYIGLKVI